MDLRLIYASNNKNVIGNEGKIPWHIPEDFRFFQSVTIGHVVVMGRKTWDSLPNKPLLHRHNVVLTRGNPDESLRNRMSDKQVRVMSSLEEAMHFYSNKTIFVIGGESLYKEAIGSASHIYQTVVYDSSDGDTFAPVIDPEVFGLISCGPCLHSIKGDKRYQHQIYKRK